MTTGTQIGRSLRSEAIVLRVRSDRPKRIAPARCFGFVGPSAQDRSDGKSVDTVQTTVGRLCGRAASRATNAYAVRAAEIALTH